MISRNEAKKKFTVDDYIRMTEGIECRKDADVIDETPGRLQTDRRGDGSAIGSRSNSPYASAGCLCEGVDVAHLP